MADGRQQAGPGQLWEIQNSSGGCLIRHAASGLYLNAVEDRKAKTLGITLGLASGRGEEKWKLSSSGECYSTVTNPATGSVLDGAAKTLLGALPDEGRYEVMLKSFEFAPFSKEKPSFAPLQYKYGGFVREAGFSYLRESSVLITKAGEGPIKTK